MTRRAKFGPMRAEYQYPPEQLAIFAQYRDQRASVRPLACCGGEGCWVDLGPPGMTNGKTTSCNKCRGVPRPLRTRAPVA